MANKYKEIEEAQKRIDHLVNQAIDNDYRNAFIVFAPWDVAPFMLLELDKLENNG